MDYKSIRMIERFVLTTLATSFIIILLFIINKIMLSEEILDFVLVNYYVYGTIIVSGFIFSSAQDFFITTKSRLGAHIAILFFCIIAMLVLSFMLQQYDAPYSLIPGMITLYIIIAYLNNFFLYHDVFLEAIDGMKGEELRTYLFHNNMVAGDFGQWLKKLQGLLFALGFIIFTAILGAKLSGVSFNPLIIAFILTFYISIFLTFMLIGLYNKEVFYAFLGFDTIIKGRNKMFRYSAIILLICSLLAIAVSTNKALIKIKPVEEKLPETVKIENPEFQLPETEISTFDLGERFTDREEPKINMSFFWYILDKIAKVVIVLGIALLLAYGLYRLITSGSIRHFFAAGLLGQFFSQLFDDLKNFFKILFHFNFEKSQAYATVQSRSFKAAMQDFLKKSKKSKAKKNEIDRLTKLFMSLIDWGSRRHLEYKVTMAPAEYTALVKSYFDSHDRSNHSLFAQKAGDLFEKALYDRDILSENEEADFTNAVKSIVSYTIQ
ncbi:MAG: hypothetical protein K5681_00360 [Treponema sp.]|nr:hypothetical protein [Treponema sp.]